MAHTRWCYCRPLQAQVVACDGFGGYAATGGASPLSNQDFFQVGFDNNGNASSGIPRVSIGSNTISTTFPSAYQFFARSTTAIPNSAFHGSLNIATSTTYLLVGRIQPNAGGYDTVSLFVNPSTFEDPGPASASVTLPSGLTTLSHAFIRTAYLDTGDAYILDEWRIGRDYGSVVQSLRNALKITPSDSPGGVLTLRWPSSLTGVVLETSTTLAPESWTEVTGPFTLSGGDYEFPIPINPGTPRGFFRLRRYIRQHWPLLPEADIDDLNSEFTTLCLTGDKAHFLTYDPERDGPRVRLRTYLCRVLDNFLSNRHRHTHAQIRGGNRHFESLDTANPAAHQERPVDDSNSVGVDTEAYDRHWAQHILSLAFNAIECGTDTTRTALPALRPWILADPGDATLKELAKELGRTHAALRAQLHRLRRSWRQAVRSAVAQTVSHPDEVDDELRHLAAVLSRHPPD